ncbi:uncharacterized protein LOC129720627 [Wyeomyia smithii]|uniref:uncharacterized protein LOC129720627 n=1 Tax=Wyeomyia smithii TaxID=174621 RepID=UPI0024680C3D|nr:uncharacterized protein LOC129720627 [Wyeomyia smithii]
MGQLQKAMQTVLSAPFFHYEEKVYNQCFGVPMGSPLSPVVANIVMEKLEQECMAKLHHKRISLTTYKRYVDDCFVIGKEDEIDAVVREFNTMEMSLKFTVEKEQSGSLRFLDITLTRTEAKITKMWFPKHEKGRYLDFTLESPYTHKKNSAIALFDRAIELTDVESRVISIQKAKSILLLNNYPTHFLQRILEQRVHAAYNTLENRRETRERTKYVSLPYIPCLSEKVGKVLRKHNIIASHKPRDHVKNTVFSKLKDNIAKMQKTNLVYSVPCGACPDVGQTSQTLEKRLAQHRYDVWRQTTTTGLAQHAIENGHEFDFSRTRILEQITREQSRISAEALHIKLSGNRSVNLQRDALGFSNTYIGMVKKLREVYENKNQPADRQRAQNENG